MQPPGSILLREDGSRSDPRSVSSLLGLTARGSIRQGCWHRPGPRLAKLNSLIPRTMSWSRCDARNMPEAESPIMRSYAARGTSWLALLLS